MEMNTINDKLLNDLISARVLLEEGLKESIQVYNKMDTNDKLESELFRINAEVQSAIHQLLDLEVMLNNLI